LNITYKPDDNRGKQKIVNINGNNELFSALFRNLSLVQNICQMPSDMKLPGVALAMVMIFVPRSCKYHNTYMCQLGYKQFLDFHVCKRHIKDMCANNEMWKSGMIFCKSVTVYAYISY